MLFNSLEFIAFFIPIYGIYLVLTHRYQNLMLLAASYFFYGCWDWRFTFLMLFSTTIDYWWGRAIHTEDDPRRRRVMLVTSLITNLGLLFVFKYYNFFAEGLNDLLAVFGLAPGVGVLRLILPVGISFYTFHNISYVVDVYNGKQIPTRNFLNFALYVAYFPQLVAGPIARAGHLLPQVEKPRHVSYKLIREGAWLILLGYFKKVVIADNMAPFADHMFGQPGQVMGLGVLAGLYAFAFQIYGDFSGYSDIARGLCKLMGFELILNFKNPYFATNPADFWKRWHISLSSWLRDYLYIPLGGNRQGSLGTYRNLLITMFLGGLWHGAAWHFVAWGIYHGLLLVGHRLMEPLLGAFRQRAGALAPLLRPASVVAFFHLTCLGWLLFGVRSLSDAPRLLSNLFSWSPLNGGIAFATMALFAGPLMILEFTEERSGKPDPIRYWPRPLRLCCYVGVFTAILMCGAVKRHEFIYFQF